jgi:arsenate reductase (thioredoxin)
MGLPRTILFLCPHNAAKSVIAAAYFHQLAAERGLDLWADSAGTDPDERPSPAVVRALLEEGIDVTDHQPRLVTAGDLAGAHRVISLGCTLDDLAPSTLQVDHWDDVPPPSRDLEGYRAAIKRHVDTLVAELAGNGM